MRLRSSKFVFLLLLACSVQFGEGYAFRMLAGQVLHTAAPTGGPTASQDSAPRASRATQYPSMGLVLSLSAQDNVAQRTPWSMSYPASASAAVASFTGLLRA